MKILILSCNTGEGHNAAGRAVKACLERRGHQAELLDMMALRGRGTTKVVGGAYVNLVKYTPRAFGLLYRAGEAIRSDKRKSPVYLANKLLAKPLWKLLQEQQFDAIVTPHLYPAETLTYMKKKYGLKLPVIAIATDYTCIPFWEETNCDYYVIPHEDLISEFAGYGIPREKIIPIGIPVHPDFMTQAKQEKARGVCQLPPDKPAYLLMSGSMGFGKIHLFAGQLASQCTRGEQLIIICGNNKKREYAMKLQFFKNPNVHVLGFTRYVAVYMEACDVIFTKPGGLSSTEAAVKGIPIVHTAPIPGCETKNVAFFTKHGMSVAADTVADQIAAGESLMDSTEKREMMRKAQKIHVNANAGFDIVKLLEQAIEDRR
ncbi:MAG: glycosyltransferase [Lachnospiraceae bacterium]|nr:glycosyltransferase [Lachnospiraceae bacterium]